jgi:WD40 repeat protein
MIVCNNIHRSFASKKITCVVMTGTGTDRVVMYADKFGNVYSYPLAAHASVAARTARRVQVSQLPVQQKGKEGGDEDEESADGLTLLLGHFSSVTSMTLDHTAQHIVTADRDEKIRVSRYPNAYNICTFCLGHTQFVSKVLVPHSSHVTVPCVISAGGDGTVRAWHLTAGTQLGQFNLASVNVTRTDASEQEVRAITPMTRVILCRLTLSNDS